MSAGWNGPFMGPPLISCGDRLSSVSENTRTSREAPYAYRSLGPEFAITVRVDFWASLRPFRRSYRATLLTNLGMKWQCRSLLLTCYMSSRPLSRANPRSAGRASKPMTLATTDNSKILEALISARHGESCPKIYASPASPVRDVLTSSESKIFNISGKHNIGNSPRWDVRKMLPPLHLR